MVMGKTNAFQEGTNFFSRRNNKVNYTTYKDDVLTAAWKRTGNQMKKAVNDYGKFAKEK